jgi:glycosyltransferase involved in cell wall biosynthesis
MDGTWDLLNDLSKDVRVRLLHHEGHSNKGVAATRNLGVNASCGQFLAFLDADDAWLPQKLKLQIETMNNLPSHVGLVFSDFYISEFPDPTIPMIEQPLQQNARFSSIAKKFQGKEDSTAEALLFDPPEQMFNWVQSPTPIVQREFFDRGLRFIEPPKLTVQFEDYLMWLVLAFHCEFVAIPDPLAIYRIHEKQFTTQFHRMDNYVQYWVGIEQVLECLYEICSEEIQRRSMNKRIDERFASMVIRSVEHANPNVMRHLLSVSLRKGFLANVLHAYLIRIFHRCHYRIRSTWLFETCRPFLKRLKHGIVTSRHRE